MKLSQLWREGKLVNTLRFWKHYAGVCFLFLLLLSFQQWVQISSTREIKTTILTAAIQWEARRDDSFRLLKNKTKKISGRIVRSSFHS